MLENAVHWRGFDGCKMTGFFSVDAYCKLRLRTGLVCQRSD